MTARRCTLIPSFPSQTARQFTPADSRFFIVEVRPSWARDEAQVRRWAGEDWRALVVKVGGKTYGVWHNLSERPVDVDISAAMVDGAKTSIHFPRGDEPGPAPFPADGTSWKIDGGSHILVVTSDDPTDHEAGWRKFPAFLEHYEKQ